MSEAEKKTRVIVIGAGAGGIATAARLAKAGFAVTVVEKNEFTGGRCSLERHEGGFRFDRGPSLLLLPGLFVETFADLDTTLEAEGVRLLRCGTNYRVWFADGERFELSTDLARMKAQVERWEGKAGFARYLAWLAEAHTHYELSVRDVLHRNFERCWAVARPAFVWTGLRIHPLDSIWRRAGKYFWTERLRRVFTFATMYMGMSPFDAPATYSLLQYTELAEGIWYPRGGFHAVLDALVRVGDRLGVRYRLGCAVKRVLLADDGRTATGVELESGERLEADIVVVNADLVYAYSNLFPQAGEAVRKYSRGLRARDASCSSISFYWSLKRRLPELETHNIFLADQYRESFDAIFDRQTLPAEPSFYVNVPTRIDPSAAPPDCDALVALVPVGHLLNSKGFAADDKDGENGGLRRREQDWEALVARARTAVLRTVAERTGCGALDDGATIAHETVSDPAAWEAAFNLDKGSILGLSHSFLNVLAFRPRTRAQAGLRGVYFVGASTHPGTGVPIVLAGAKITSEQILTDRGLAVPWAPLAQHGRDDGVARTPGAAVGPLDRIDRRWALRGVSVSSSLAVLLLFVLLPGCVALLAYHWPR